MVAIGSAGVLAPGKWRPLRTLGWMALLCVLVVALFNALSRGVLLLVASRFDLASTNAAPDVWKLVAALAGSAALVALYWGAVRWGERRRVVEMDLRPAPGELLLGLVIGAGVIAAIIGLQWMAGWVVIEANMIDRVALALRDSIRSAVLEELVLRLVIFRLVWRAAGVWPALIVSALLFGGLHLANPDSSLFAAACLIAGEGIAIGLYLLTGRIWAAMGMHAGWNFTQGWIFGAAVSGTTEIAGGPLILKAMAGAPNMLSGGGFGPEASLAALIISALASVGLLLWAWRQGRFVAMDA